MQPIVRVPAVGVVLAAALVVTGCADSAPPVIPTAQPSTAPVFATNADALAAAKKAYVGYQHASDAIGQDGGADSDRIAPWVTKSRVPVEKRQFASLNRTGDHLTGSSSFDSFRLQQVDQSAGVVSVTVYVCDDVAESRVINAGGKDVTPQGRMGVIPIVVDFRSARARSSRLLVEGSTLWTGSDFCAHS
jgi:hypothetical protein